MDQAHRNECDDDLEIVSTQGPITTYRCRRDGTEFSAISDFAPAVPEDTGNTRVLVRWRAGKPTAAELLAVRRLMPALRDYPIYELGRNLENSQVLDLGDYFKFEASALAEQGNEMGLLVEVEEHKQPGQAQHGQ